MIQIIAINKINPPIIPVLATPERSMTESIPATANIARRMPTSPSPAIIPEQNKTPEPESEFEFEIIDWGEIQKIAEEIEQEQPELLQIEEQQETKIHSGLDIDFISESCDNSFTDNQISALISVINKDNLSDADKKQYGLNIAIYNYLSRKYRLFVALEQDTVIYNRFKYFYSMIEGDTQ